MKLLFENWRKYLNESHVPDTNVVLIIKPSDIHGKGIFAGEHVSKGTELGISHVRRGGDNWDIPPLGKYHNHSDQPNCVSVADAPLEGEKYSRKMVASRDIPAGEEVTVDYKLQPDLEQPGEWAIQ